MHCPSIVQEVPLKSEVSAWGPSAVEKHDNCDGQSDYWGGTFQPNQHVNIGRVCSCWLTSPQHILIGNVAENGLALMTVEDRLVYNSC